MKNLNCDDPDSDWMAPKLPNGFYGQFKYLKLIRKRDEYDLENVPRKIIDT